MSYREWSIYGGTSREVVEYLHTRGFSTYPQEDSRAGRRVVSPDGNVMWIWSWEKGKRVTIEQFDRYAATEFLKTIPMKYHMEEITHAAGNEKNDATGLRLVR